jgi:hypothetical protein
MIHVRRTAERASPTFEVIVREGSSETHHHVTMSQEMGANIRRSAVWKRPSGSCSTASQRNRSSDAST